MVNDSAPNTHSLTVTGSASFGGIVGSTALNSLHVTVATTINTTAVTTSTTQAYDGATTIGGNANLSGTTVTFGSTVDDSSIGAHALTVTGSASFGGIVGSTALKSIHVTVSTTINPTAITTSTTQAITMAQRRSVVTPTSAERPSPLAVRSTIPPPTHTR